jgi:hypothetical protein
MEVGIVWERSVLDERAMIIPSAVSEPDGTSTSAANFAIGQVVLRYYVPAVTIDIGTWHQIVFLGDWLQCLC